MVLKATRNIANRREGRLYDAVETCSETGSLVRCPLYGGAITRHYLVANQVENVFLMALFLASSGDRSAKWKRDLPGLLCGREEVYVLLVVSHCDARRSETGPGTRYLLL